MPQVKANVIGQRWKLVVRPSIKITVLLNKEEEYKNTPGMWKKDIIIKMPKKSDLTNKNNWWDVIHLTVILQKTLPVIFSSIKETMEMKTRGKYAECQCGKSCINHIFTLKITGGESNKTIHCVTDFKKIFDYCLNASLQTVWKCYSNKIISIIKTW